MKNLYFSLLAIVSFSAFSQVSTPNTGVTWNLDSLVAHLPSAFSLDTNFYAQVEDLTVSKNDTLKIEGSHYWIIDSAVRITVEGSFITEGTPNGSLVMESFDTSSTWDGLRFEDSSYVSIKNTIISHSGGLRVLTENFKIDSCQIVRSHAEGTSPSGAINISRGKPFITNCTINLNAQPAIASGANQQVSAYIKNCMIAGNNLENSNRPQINLGPTHPDDSTYILNSSIIGDSNLDKVGAISVSTLLGGYSVNAVIDSNYITNNRYGITMYSATYARISNNQIVDNDAETNPMNGGSGISLYNGSNVRAYQNNISGNLWGITLLGSASINLGDTASGNFNIGQNVFSNNGNGGVTYALYNNTTNTITALNNCWTGDSSATLADAEDVIFHSNDNNTLGEVLFDPIWDCREDVDSTSGLMDYNIQDLDVYPNPSASLINLNSKSNGTLEIHNTSGILMKKILVASGDNRITHHLSPGIYLLTLHSDKQLYRSKLIVR